MGAAICVGGRKILSREAFKEATALVQVEDGRDLNENDRGLNGIGAVVRV